MENYPVIFMPGYKISIQGRKGEELMPYIPPQVVQEAKRMGLLTYLKKYEPYELVHFPVTLILPECMTV